MSSPSPPPATFHKRPETIPYEDHIESLNDLRKRLKSYYESKLEECAREQVDSVKENSRMRMKDYTLQLMKQKSRIDSLEKMIRSKDVEIYQLKYHNKYGGGVAEVVGWVLGVIAL